MSNPTGYVVNNYNYDSEPISVQCFNCKNHVTTSTTESCNTICCIIFGCWALCCCQDVEHRCPQCNIVLGTCKSC